MPFLLALLGLSLPLSAWSGTLIMKKVGDDGGYRVGSTCLLGGKQTICPIDSGSPFSLVSLAEWNKSLPSLGREDLGSVGLSVRCEKVKLQGFQMLDISVPDLIFHRCEGLPSVESLIGLNFFADQRVTFRFQEGGIDLGSSYYGLVFPLVTGTRSGKEKLLLPASVGAEKITIAFDTGAPVTLVDQKLVDRHPEIFVESTKPPSEMMIRRGLRRFEMHGPFVVNGVTLQAEFVHTTDVMGFSAGDYPVLLGMNHLRNADWFFDLRSRTWAIYQ